MKMRRSYIEGFEDLTLKVDEGQPNPSYFKKKTILHIGVIICYLVKLRIANKLSFPAREDVEDTLPGEVK